MTAPEVGPIGLGCASIGNLYREMSEADAAGTLQAAWDGGSRYFDTAPHYGLGLSERRLGRFLADRPRDGFLVSTKVGRLLVENPDYSDGDTDDEGFAVPATLKRQWDPSEAGIRRSLEESLTRLGLERADIVYLHDPDAYDLAAGIEQGLPVLEKLRAEGTADAVGVGANSAETLLACVEAAELDYIMLSGCYTLLDQPAAHELLPACLAKGVQVINVGVYATGILAQPQVPAQAHYKYAPASADIQAKAARIAGICERFGTDLPTAALHFSLRHPAVAAVVAGASSAAQAAQNAARIQAPVPEELWAALAAEELIPHGS
ncbi:aldo/keto reductase [Arthrobacter sp. Sa2BUA2]|uniref:Aldo/keto reductase n=1 Tax=Arthrobacter pullicola TaxID=2762224 RepID=A0ABR8YKM9_9MICC|nr:aldo/keto reductase [Arthrobacter pullicola]MBD8044805.1 aldo/keto reductase [Arthrobacter pullicola]